VCAQWILDGLSWRKPQCNNSIWKEVQQNMPRRIKVKGVRRSEIDTEQLALVYWLQAKRVLREKREREARERAKRRGVTDES
jgi:hypothetical protein